MSAKIIRIENRGGPARSSLHNIMRLVPEEDQRDQKLRRMLAFRLQLDGEALTTAYLVTNIREVVRCAYRGSFFEFLRTDRQARERRQPQHHPDPPSVA